MWIFIVNCLVCICLFIDVEGVVNGVFGFDCCSGDFYVICVKVVIFCCGVVGCLGLLFLGYLMGIYENLINVGDGYVMVYYVGVELVNLECF